MQVKAILFDIDGTLVDSNDLHVLAWREAFESIGMNFSGPEIHAQIGKGADMLIPALVPDLDAATCQELGKLQGGIFRRKYRASVKPFRHAFELLAHSSECQQQVVLASSASQDDLSHYMDELNIRELVAATTSGGEVENTKPSPDIFSTALAKLKGVTAEEVMVVGILPTTSRRPAKLAFPQWRCGPEGLRMSSCGMLARLPFTMTSLRCCRITPTPHWVIISNDRSSPVGPREAR
ncbi:HAD family phosphatase [Agrobacterium sp. Ap1]|uniref:HAD family hydrolase n=1 Tax=Rhizobium/Agrobacterium group TaxID=227290 RepID=UPI000F9F679D|nr:HAD family phosphatase [Agrobacterium sp. Ap1]MBO0144987.1 HAD family phosphatase [Agrobacterium sp. Ap1]